MPALGDQELALELRALYQGPLADFVGARKALAKRLRQAGDPRHAEVAELRKPGLSAWAVNRLFALALRAAPRSCSKAAYKRSDCFL